MGSGFTTDKIAAVGHLFSQEMNILLLHGSYINEQTALLFAFNTNKLVLCYF